MKLRIVEKLDCRDCEGDIGLTNDEGFIIARIHRWVHDCGYNPLRLARLFQRAEELEEFTTDWNDLRMNNKFVKKWGHIGEKDSRIAKLLHYVDNGDQEEMVEVLVPDAMKAVSYRKFISRSEAVRLGLIKE
jgi:hypothetical protein